MFVKIFKNGKQTGQALLIVVLVMVIALTVGLSVASRAIINLRNTADQSASQKALAAAEAGVEQTIKAGGSAPSGQQTFPGSGGNTTYSTTSSNNAPSGNFLLNFGADVNKDDSIYLWVTPYSAYPNTFNSTWNGSLTIFWGDDVGNCTDSPNASVPALEVAVIYGTKASPSLKRYALDPCAATRNNNFTNAGISQTTTPFPGSKIGSLYYKTTTPIDLTAGTLGAGVLLVRITPIYATSVIGVFGNGLPAQGTTITSTGTFGQATRTVSVFQGYPEIPAVFFPYTLFQP